MTRDRDREVKFQKNSREFSRIETLAGHWAIYLFRYKSNIKTAISWTPGQHSRPPAHSSSQCIRFPPAAQPQPPGEKMASGFNLVVTHLCQQLHLHNRDANHPEHVGDPEAFEASGHHSETLQLIFHSEV